MLSSLLIHFIYINEANSSKLVLLSVFLQKFSFNSTLCIFLTTITFISSQNFLTCVSTSTICIFQFRDFIKLFCLQKLTTLHNNELTKNKSCDNSDKLLLLLHDLKTQTKFCVFIFFNFVVNFASYIKNEKFKQLKQNQF